MGTVGYMAPEQVRGVAADARADIFSFGVVLYEMLSGRRAFTGDSAAETMAAIVTKEPPELAEANPSLPPALERIVRRCLEKLPEQRFQSSHDLAFALDALSTSSGKAAAIVPRRGKTWKRVVTAIAVLGAGIVLGVLGEHVRTTQSGEAPTYRRLTFARGYVTQARFAPDNNTIVYSAAWRGEPIELFTTRLDSPESRPFGLGSATLLAVSSTSELATGHDCRGCKTMLSRVPLSGGSPRDVVDAVTWADWSPDGSDLAVVRVLENSQRLEFPIGNVLYETHGHISHLRVSPRGDRVAFIDHPPRGDAGVVVALDRNGARTTLSQWRSDTFGLAWHPDGREVWFTAGMLGDFKSLRAVTLDGKERLIARMLGEIQLLDISRDQRVLLSREYYGAELKALPPGASAERDLTWLGFSSLADLSSDGSRVLFSELRPGAPETGVTYLRQIDGTPAVRLTDGGALALSPDGKWALCSLRSPGRLVIVPTGAGEQKTLPGAELTSVRAATWFPDSRRVLFIGATQGDEERAYIQDIEGGQRKAIGPAGLGSSRVAVSPSGETIAASMQDGAIVFSPDGTQLRPCRGTLAGDQPIQWSADGHSLYVTDVKRQTTQVVRIELATGQRTLLYELAARDPAGAGAPLSMRLTADGKSYAYTLERDLDDLFLVEGLK
jgi:Tol biopolymer transport system component